MLFLNTRLVFHESKKTRESAKKYMETEEDEGVTTYLDLRSPLGLISFNTKPSPSVCSM